MTHGFGIFMTLNVENKLLKLIKIMKTQIATIAAAFAIAASANAQLVIQGVVDGDLSGGLPKAIVLKATADVADLSVFGIGSANNGEGSDGEEFTLTGGSATEGQLIVVATDLAFFNNYVNGDTIYFTSGAASINGDDAVELFGSSVVIDTYGDVNVNGDGEAWDYTDSYAVRTGGVAGAYIEGNYSYAGLGALDGLDEATHLTVLDGVFGFDSVNAVPEPSAFAGIFGLVALLAARRRA